MKILQGILYLGFISFFSYLQAQISLTEVMFDVETNEYHDEFIEIYNLSYSDSFLIEGWQFSDSSGTDRILPVGERLYFPPRSFAVILDQSYFGNSQTYDGRIADSVLILTISDNAFGSSGLSNTVGEYLTISDSNGHILTAYRYSPGNMPGFSDEKIRLDGENDPDNWQDSKTAGGTPGRSNSVSPHRVDYGLERQGLSLPDIIFEGEPVPINLEIFHYGTDHSDFPLQVEVFADLDSDGYHGGNDISIYIGTLRASAQLLAFTWDNPPAGNYNLVASLTQSEDQFAENDRLVFRIDVYTQSEDLIINEIKFLPENDEPEWIEIFNNGSSPVYFKNWSLLDAKDTVMIDTAAMIGGRDYLVISDGILPARYALNPDRILQLRKFPVLNDQEDQLRLLTPAGKPVETIAYQSDWLEGEAWRRPSLEKINPDLNGTKPENWGPSLDVNGGTPGRKNSLFARLNPGISEINVSPDPFSPDGDGFDDVTLISGQLSLPNARIRAQLFDIKGRLIRTLEDNRFSGNRFNLVWDGQDNNGQTARIGVYIVYLQILNDRQGILKELKTTVVLARRL